MKKKALCLFVLLLITSILTSCTFTNLSVEDLLVAPSLSEDQKSVMKALEEGRTNRISFVYPLTGSNRSAIQKYDIDRDGEEEIIAFYKDSSEGLNAKLSILERKDDATYYVSSTSEGFGDSINSVFYLSSLVAQDAILIEWKSPSKSSNTVSVFTYIDSNLEIGFEENSLNMIVLDMDENESSEFCYIVPATADSGFSRKYVRSNETTIFSRSQYNLSQDVVEILSVNTGTLKNNVNAIFIDESTSNGYQSEVFTLSDDNSRLNRAEIEGGIDLLKLSFRDLSINLTSTSFNDITCFPSSIAPNSDILSPDSWVYWYTIDDHNISFENVTYFSNDLGFLLSIPSSWLSTCNVYQTSDNSIEIRQVSENEDEEEQMLISVVMLSVDEDNSSYISDGYSLIGSNGTSRYYMLSNTSSEDANFIQTSFIVFD